MENRHQPSLVMVMSWNQSGVLMTLLLRSRDGQAEEGVAAAVEAVSKEAAAGE